MSRKKKVNFDSEHDSSIHHDDGTIVDVGQFDDPQEMPEEDDEEELTLEQQAWSDLEDALNNGDYDEDHFDNG